MLRAIISLAAAVSSVHATGRYGNAEAGSCRGAEANPSVYNFAIGPYAAKVISDGRLLFTPPDVFQDDPYLITQALTKNFQSVDPVIFENNMLYVEWGGDRIMFDTGNGFVRSETAGWLFNQLKTEGIERESITKIFINHGHFDHVSGLVVDENSNGPAFPNADIYISQEELDFWTGPDPSFENDLDEDARAFLVDTFNLIFNKVKDKVKTFPLGQEDIVPGITSLACPYHTPGSSAFILTPSQGDPLFYAGDCLGIESLTINNQFRLRFDTVIADGAVGRVRILEKLAAERMKALLFHDSFPGLGYIVPNDLTWDVKRVNWEFSEAVKTTCPV